MQRDELENFIKTLESMSEQTLTRHARRYICQSLFAINQEGLEIDVQTALDVLYAEFYNRGMERLYDMTYESVSKNPDSCKAT